VAHYDKTVIEISSGYGFNGGGMESMDSLKVLVFLTGRGNQPKIKMLNGWVD